MSKARDRLTESPIPVDESFNPFQPIQLPTFEKPNEAELERRRRLFERIMQIRKEIYEQFGPLDISTGELKHLAREEAEE
ncbi:hypothetical protein BH23CHL2_BH23CHL2_15370 [soil metagenome]